MRTTTAGALVTALAFAGCGGDPETPRGTLHVIIDAPPAPVAMTMGGTERRQFLVLQARPQLDHAFEVDWEADPAADALVSLAPAARTEARVTIRGEDDTINVQVKAAFCVDEGCGDFLDVPPPAVWFAIEDPIYIGETTEYRVTIEAPTEAPMDASCAAACDDYECAVVEAQCDVTFVDKCQVRGCVEGDPAINYCRSADGTHFCEPAAAP